MEGDRSVYLSGGGDVGTVKGVRNGGLLEEFEQWRQVVEGERGEELRVRDDGLARERVMEGWNGCTQGRVGVEGGGGIRVEAGDAEET